MIMTIDDLKTPNSNEPLPNGLQTSRRLIQVEGVQLFNEFYFNPALTNFIGETVEVRYDVKNLSRISIVLPDFRTVEAETIAVFTNDGEYATQESLLKDSLKLVEVEAKNKLMESALWQALEIRRIFAELSDPLTLAGEKSKLRARYAQIELNIREVLFEGGIQ